MKKVTLTIVARNDEQAAAIADMMEDSHIAQQGLFCLACGTIEKLTGDEEWEVLSQLPDDIRSDILEQ